MFDIGWSEMAVIAVVALIVIGPRDLPKLLFTAGKMAAKARATLAEFQQGLAEMAREAELEELRKKIDAARDLDPQREIAKAFDPTGEIEASLDAAVLPPQTATPPSPPVLPAEAGGLETAAPETAPAAAAAAPEMGSEAGASEAVTAPASAPVAEPVPGPIAGPEPDRKPA